MSDLPLLVSQALTTHPTITVATTDGCGGVDCASMFFAFDEAGTIYFATAEGTLKAANLRQVPRVALAVDDSHQMGVQIRGDARQLSGTDAASARSRLLKRHPSIAKFLDKPGVSYYAVTPTERFLINFAWGVDWRVTVP